MNKQASAYIASLTDAQFDDFCRETVTEMDKMSKGVVSIKHWRIVNDMHALMLADMKRRNTLAGYDDLSLDDILTELGA